MEEYKPKLNLRRVVIVVILAIVLMALAGWLLSREDFYEMLAVIRNANYLLIGAAVALYFINLAIWAGRWQTALSFINCRISFGSRYSIICATVFLNNLSPGARVGGDPFGRIYMLRKLENTSYSSGMVFFKKRVAIKGISNVAGRVLSWFRKRNDVQATLEGIEALYSSTYAIMDKWQKVALIGGWTLLIGVSDILRLSAIFLALGYQPTLSTLLVASSVEIIVGLVPLLPGGLILVEGSLISILALLGIPLDVAMAATLIERGITFVLSTIVGGGVFSYLGVKMAAKSKVQDQTKS